MKSKKFISFITAVAMIFAMLPSVVFAVDESEVYSCNFTQLVKDNVQTTYGTSTDIITLDDYTTAYLTHEGTYADTDGKVYLTGSNNGRGDCTNGSYIEFTAPSDGTASFYANAYNYYIDGTYTSYNKSAGTATVDLTAGQKLQIGQRISGTYISSLTFTPSQSGESTPEPGTTDAPEPGGDIEEYKSPSTLWEFGSSPPSTGKNTPVMGGNAVWSDGEVQFPADNTSTGTLTVDMENAIRNNVTVEFDAADHSKALGQQYFNFSIGNSEETIVDFQVHPYSDDYTSVKGLVICGKTIADYATVRIAWGGIGTHHIKTDIDYNAGKVTVAVGTTVFTGDIPEGTVSDFKEFEISSTRSKTAADRYISVDNLKIAEFDSTEPPAEVTVTDGYETATIAGINCRAKAKDNAPAVIYLASELRMGTDGYSQLYDAKPLFDMLDGKATLIAPQTDGLFTDISALVSTVKETYNASEVIVVGQSQNASAALSSGGDKIITIAGKGDTTPTRGKVWAFAGYADEVTPVADVKTMVNRLQTAKIDTNYTEYPYEGHKINEKAASDAAEWILSDAVGSKTVDLAIFMGQSNMAGRGDYADATECEVGHGYEYHSVTEPGVLTTVSEPFGKYENNSTVNDAGSDGIDRRGGDMVSAFMESYYEVSGVPIVGVQCSRGGTATSYWTGNVITEAANRYKEAEEYLTSCGYTIGKKFMVWCQGEADADNGANVSTYKSNTKAIFEAMKSNTDLTDMFMVRIGHCKTSGAAAIDELKDARYKQINLAQKELADDTEGITAVASFYTDEYAELMRDQYHYHQEAYNSIGEIAGNNAAYTLYNTGTWTNYPEPAADTDATPMPIEKFEVTSSASSVDVSGLAMYDNTTYRLYKADGSYETVMASDGKIANTSGGEVTVVPEYKFEFTNQTNPTDEYIKGYVKVSENSYTVDSGYGLVSGGSYSINENGCKVDENPIKIDLSKGYYDVKIYRKGGARADIYANGVQIINNTTSSGSQNRPSGSGLMSAPGIYFSDGSTYITFGNMSGTNERIASIEIVRVPEKFRKPVVWIAGDSESANYYPIDSEGDDLESDKIMMTGFGMQLDKFLSDKYSVANWGQPSATVKTWYNECFESINTLMHEGDTILIDFGINDSISSSNAISIDDMKTYMKNICDAAKSKGVTPIIISPVYNTKYQHRTYFTYSADTDTNAMYAFAEEIGVDCIDLNKYMQLYANKAAADTGDTSWVTNNYHVADNLHLTQHSALLAASFIAAGMSEMDYETTDYSYTYKDISSIGEGNVRGTETGTTRVYSVMEAKKFMGIEITETPKPTDKPQPKVTMSYDEESGNVTITSTDNNIIGGTLIKTVYDGGILKSVSSGYVSFAEGTNVTAEKGMVLYLWDSLGGMKPLAEPYRYSGEGTNPTASPTVSPTSSPTTAPTEEPKTMIYSQDFETYSIGDNGGWTSPAGTVSV
ncbi:MAG: sialate O-acetylesterase, partial [Clostridia bacterium]